MPANDELSVAPATWYAIKGGNDLYWRCEAPARAVDGKACLIPDGDEAWAALTKPNEDSAIPWRFTADRNDPSYWEIEFPGQEGTTAVWNRPNSQMAILAMAMRERLGFRTLSEVDDNYFADAKLNLFLRHNRWGESERDRHAKALASMDGIVVSTPLLRDIYWKQLRARFGKKMVPPLYVCGNHVAASDWPERLESDTGRVRVGWMGSPSHIWDVDLAWPALLWASRNGCDTYMIGYDPGDPNRDDPLPTTDRANHKTAQWKKVGFTYIPWVDPGKYHRLPLPLDIGLCPLLRNDMTVGKSDVKWIEYSISGAAVVAMNNEVYNRTIVHGETGLLVGSPEEMLEAVRLLVGDRKLRERLVLNAQQYIREERGLKQMRQEWTAAING